MIDNYIKAYKTARKTASLTQERAAELLNVSTRTLADYESGKVTPPGDIVYSMVKIYKAPYLAFIYLKTSSKIGMEFLPDITCFNDLPRAVLTLKKEFADVQSIDSDMVAVVCDGVVDADEKPIWNKVTTEIRQAAGAALQVLFSK